MVTPTDNWYPSFCTDEITKAHVGANIRTTIAAMLMQGMVQINAPGGWAGIAARAVAGADALISELNRQAENTKGANE